MIYYYVCNKILVNKYYLNSILNAGTDTFSTGNLDGHSISNALADCLHFIS